MFRGAVSRSESWTLTDKEKRYGGWYWAITD